MCNVRFLLILELSHTMELTPFIVRKGSGEP